MSKKAHASSYMLPITVMILIPWLLMWLTADMTQGMPLVSLLDPLIMLWGLVLLFTGVVLMAGTIRMFTIIGKGTLAPWAPTKKLVVVGIYSFMRNPMITGVLLGLMGETIILSNFAVFLWVIFFFIGNHIYFIRSEEPSLLKRFGEEYAEYFDNVPRWIPRSTPWTPSKDPQD